jgi:membrane protein implicated in regulation of membrane protease activity
MEGVISHLSGTETFFLVCAALGGGIFFVRLIIQLVGGLNDLDTEISAGHGDIEHADADSSFKHLSIQGLTSFFMMFGLVGFALLRGSRTSEAIALLGAVAAGFATVWVIGKIFTVFRGLQSSGTIDIRSTLGEKGTVYLTIPAGGPGKVQIVVKGRLREFSAISRDQIEIKTGTPVHVVQIDGNILIVEKYQSPA